MEVEEGEKPARSLAAFWVRLIKVSQKDRILMSN